MDRRFSTSLATAVKYLSAASLSALCLFASAPARADIDVRINIGNAPPPPRFVFQSRPHERYYSGEGVYVVDDPGVGDNDVFRYGGYYWVFNDGYWYRAYSWRGPFRVIYPRYVPTVFYRMPATRWKHHPSGPPRYGRGGGMPQPTGPPRYARPGNPPLHVPTGGGSPPGHIQRHDPAPRVQPAAPPARGPNDRTPPGQKKKDHKGDEHDKGHGK